MLKFASHNQLHEWLFWLSKLACHCTDVEHSVMIPLKHKSW